MILPEICWLCENFIYLQNESYQIVMKHSTPLKIDIQSEIGRLDAVLLHRPGAEVENMTPRNVQRALYSDILNLSIAQQEYEQLTGVLSRIRYRCWTVQNLSYL